MYVAANLAHAQDIPVPTEPTEGFLKPSHWPKVGNQAEMFETSLAGDIAVTNITPQRVGDVEVVVEGVVSASEFTVRVRA
jgi:hypothetical protein